ncbi:MAG: universal stress protein [Burkholderiales bacterium]
MRVLVAVDGSANSDRAVRHLIDLVPEWGPMEVLLLNVQPPMTYIELLTSPREELIAQLTQSAGREASQSAIALLNAAGVPYTLHIVAGYPGETIAQFARKQGCDLIVMGTRGMGAIPNLLLGSVATKVIHLADIPVTLVK